MELKGILESGSNVQIVINAQDLKTAIFEWSKEREAQIEAAQKNRHTEYYTAAQAMAALKICKTTLNKWAKQGILTPTKIGGLLRYSKADIERLMQ